MHICIFILNALTLPFDKLIITRVPDSIANIIIYIMTWAGAVVTLESKCTAVYNIMHTTLLEILILYIL